MEDDGADAVAHDGYWRIEKIRERRDASGAVPAGALTAFARDEDRRRALRAGFDAHLAKPLRVEVLARAVAAVRSRETGTCAN